MTGYIILSVFTISGTIVHYRGKRRFKFFRQIFDHSTFMAPINLLMYLFSRVPNKPFLDLDLVPELKKITENWETIRDEALYLNTSKNIKSSDSIMILDLTLFSKTVGKGSI